MFGRLFRKPAPGPVSPGAALAKLGRDQHRAQVRATTNQMRADMRAKGVAYLPDIDWSNL